MSAGESTRTFGRYEVLAEIGKGAMGVVYKARDPMLNRLVAVKTIHMDLDPGQGEDYKNRFFQEARAAGGLNHPNIITIYDVGANDDIAYMAMELLEGHELRQITSTGKAPPLNEIISIVSGVARGLAYAQDHGVVHRDIKPANIMILGDGRVKIMDFGIARMRASEVRTQTGMVLGSPRYMSPEQSLGKPVDTRSDIFSLGVVLYELLTGRPPFNGTDASAIRHQTLNHQPPAPSTLNPSIPEMLDFIVAKMLAKSPEDRYAHATELADDLQASLQASASAPSTPKPAAKLDDTALEAAADVEHFEVGLDEENAAVTQGLSRAFDSGSATQRLVAGADPEKSIDEYIDTQRRRAAQAQPAVASHTATSPLGETTLPLAGGWDTRQKIVFAVIITVALAAAYFIAFH
jgi:serine/threonine-protein kinase